MQKLLLFLLSFSFNAITGMDHPAWEGMNFQASQALAITQQPADIATLAQRALSAPACELATVFKQIDEHPDAARIRETLIDDNKHVWFCMAANFSSENSSDKSYLYLNLRQATNTAQWYDAWADIHAVGLSPDGSLLCGALITNQVFSIKDPRQLAEVKIPTWGNKKIVRLCGIDNERYQVFTLNGIYPAAWPLNGDLPKGVELGKRVKKLLVSPNGKLIMLIDFEHSHCLGRLTDNGDVIASASISLFNNNCIAQHIAVDDNSVFGVLATSQKVTCLQYGKRNIDLNGISLDISSPIVSVDICANGDHALVACENKLIRFNPKKIFSSENSTTSDETSENAITAARLSRCGKYVVKAGWDGRVAIINFENGRQTTATYRDALFTMLALNSADDTIAVGGNSSIMKFSMVPILQKLKRATPSQVATLIRLKDGEKEFSKSALLKAKFLSAIVPNKHMLLKYRNIQPEDIGARECPICFEQLADTITACAHQFCSECLETHVKSSPTCPQCRTPISAQP